MPESSPTDAPLAGRRVTVIGAGAVATAMARHARTHGAEVRLWSRRPEAAAAAAGHAGAEAVEDLGAALDGVGLLLACVRDDAIAPVAERAAAALRAPAEGAAAMHTSGLWTSERLAPLGEAGFALGSLHPLCAIRPGTEGDVALEGSAFAFEGSERAREWAALLARAAGGRLIELSGDAASKAAYHAGAALVSNGLAALVERVAALWSELGIGEAELRDGLASLVAAEWRSLARDPRRTPPTGPVARGDAEAVARHLEALGRADPSGETLALYRAIGRRLLATARLGEEERARIAALLAGDAPPA